MPVAPGRLLQPNLRAYGDAPYRVVVIHGGPGAAGEGAPVARTLAAGRGVLEPLQTATSLAGQVEELRAVLEAHAALPATLIGHSWGAWLACLVAARYPALVGKLILVGSGAFEERYVTQLAERRLSRLSAAERPEFEGLARALDDPEAEGRDARLARLGALATKADTYDPLPEEPAEAGAADVRGDIYGSVWHEAAALRHSGELASLASRIRCPVTAIHGDYDPTPAEGVRGPLAAVPGGLRFVLLERCGHAPWRERYARDAFYRILEEELSGGA